MSFLNENPLSRLVAWCKGHEEFFAVKLSRLLSVLFILAGVFFLLRSIGIV